ncbi:3D domain-containing protein [Oceanisphaera pacifica]|uniref:3D domain-containing protein n=1 Tax=Oceanisphaera pacifica TaxID=2818389 RepID=A0ABS3NG63_9GAMM|nr:3D domain-containing protein [Oceanisphaera pacifica]MBO1519530.1 3D domain-containing protein [Oceanisphaera pacifica]
MHCIFYANPAMLGALLVSLLLAGCSKTEDETAKSSDTDEVGVVQVETVTATVTATAYTLAEDETKKGNIGLAAWGDILVPGMKAIAVSRDLIGEGLTHNTEVEIAGFEGKYRVLDKMNKRWRQKIDILMLDKKQARAWGKRPVDIIWQVPVTEQLSQ